MKDLKKQPDFTVYDAFRTIDKYNEGFINEGNLSDFFKSQGLALTQAEIYCIIRRINTHGDARISIEEFADFLGESVYVSVTTKSQISKTS